jgi:hypothetical protein
MFMVHQVKCAPRFLENINNHTMDSDSAPDSDTVNINALDDSDSDSMDSSKHPDW